MPEVVVVLEPMPRLPWTMGTWAGLAQWRCRVCPFDALSEAEMVAHVAAHVAARSETGLSVSMEPPAGPSGVLVADKYGNERR